MRPMIQFYVQSMRVKGRKPMPSTAAHVSEMLDRVFNTLESSYGVVMRDNKITGLNTEVLQRWINDASESWKPATFNNYISILNPFLRWAHKMKGSDGEYIEDDLSILLRTQSLPNPEDLPEEDRPKSKYYSVDQVENLLHGGYGRNNIRDTAIVAMILWSSLRVSELCQITVGNFRQGKAAHTVRVQRKGSVAMKDVEIADPAYSYVEAYLKTRKELRDDQPLFMTTHGQPCNRTQIYKCLSFKQKQLGLATGPHALRHTSLSAQEKEAPLSVVRDIANHKDFRVTNRYTHSTHEERLAALNALPWK